MTEVQPRYCNECRKVRECQRPGGAQLFFFLLIIGAFVVFFYFSQSLGPAIALGMSGFVVAMAIAYLVIAQGRPWVCRKCGLRDTAPVSTRSQRRSTDDDEDDVEDEEDRPRRSPRR